MANSMNTVPMEIISKILKKVHEPLKIIKLQLVSKKWQKECEKLYQFIDWKKYCLENFNTFSLYSIITVTLLKVQVKNHRIISDQKYWKQIFDSYVIWQSFKSQKLHITSTTNRWTVPFLQPDEKITCCDTWSFYTAVGTNEGKTFIFSNYDFLKPDYIIPSIKKAVKTIKFWYTEFGKLLLIRQYDNKTNYLKFWDVEQGIELRTLKQNISAESFCVGSAQFFYGCAALIFFKCSPSSSTYKEMITSTYFINLRDDQSIRAMSSFESTVYMLICDDSSIQFHTVKHVDQKRKNSFEIPPLRRGPKLPEDITEKTLFYVLFDETIICIGDSMLHFLTVDSKDWTSILMEEIFMGKIQSLVVHANLLCLGVKGGKLYMYNMKSPKELQSPGFFKCSVPRIIDLKSDEPFIDLKVTHVFENATIMVATQKTLWGICTTSLNTEHREAVHSSKLECYYY